jgi:hypothetical protein
MFKESWRLRPAHDEVKTDFLMCIDLFRPPIDEKVI